MYVAIRVRAESQADAMPRVAVRWIPAVRVVPLFPPISAIEQLDPSLQAAALAEIVAVSPGILGQPGLLPSGALPTGQGASQIITSFTFSKPARFNDETFAAFYAGNSLDTAIAETVHHVRESLRDVNAPAQTLPTRAALHVDVDARVMLDARNATYTEIYDPDDYTESQIFGYVAVRRSVQGIVFRSVRQTGGECIAVYDPAALANCRQDRRLIYQYDGSEIEVSEIHYPSKP